MKILTLFRRVQALWRRYYLDSHTRVVKPSEYFGSMTVHSNTGFRIDVFCERQVLRRLSAGFLQRVSLHHLYKVFATVSDDAPESLRRACRYEQHYPNLLPVTAPSDAHLEAVMNAYLDSLQAHLSENQVSLVF